MNVTLKRADEKSDKAFVEQPGVWWKDEHGRVYVTCQHPHAYPAMIFGHADASKNWQIDAHGRVTPSIWIKGDCEWHVFATLDGWEAGKPSAGGALLAAALLALLALGATGCVSIVCRERPELNNACRDTKTGRFVPCEDAR